MAQASAAAVLRSGYLAQRRGPGSLRDRPRSARVRLAESLLDGVRQGQSLGSCSATASSARLHERGLDRFMPGFRRDLAACPRLRGAGAARVRDRVGGIGSFPIQALEAMQTLEAAAGDAARARLGTARDGDGGGARARSRSASLTDGLALARSSARGAVPFDAARRAARARRARSCAAELRALDEAVDALGDALTAEGVYQAVRGNPARAAASVDALAHGEIQPPELEFVADAARRARRSRTGWSRCSARRRARAAGRRARARGALAEPALELWLRQMLGDLRQVRLRAPSSSTRPARSLLRKETAAARRARRLAARRALPRRIAPSSTSSGCSSTRCGTAAPARSGGTPCGCCRSGRARTCRRRLSLGEFLELNAAFREAVLGARALDAPDFHDDGRARRAGGRRGRARARARTRRSATLQRRPRRRWRAPDDVRARLVDLALPRLPRGGPCRRARDRVPAHDLAEADRRLAAVDAMALDRATAAPEQRVAFDQARLQAVFGAASARCRSSGRRTSPSSANSLRRSDELQGGDPLQALSWLQGASRVRPGASRLGRALAYAAALERTPALALKVAQLPFVAGERWIGLPPARRRRAGKLSLVAHLPRPFQASAPLSGLVFDEWVEVVPAREVTTGVSFNYDAPGARPPQASCSRSRRPGTARWEVETLEETLLETLELAQLRAVDPQALGGDPLLQRALPALYVTGNLGGEQISTDFAERRTHELDHVLDAARAVLAPRRHRRRAAGARQRPAVAARAPVADRRVPRRGRGHAGAGAGAAGALAARALPRRGRGRRSRTAATFRSRRWSSASRVQVAADPRRDLRLAAEAGPDFLRLLERSGSRPRRARRSRPRARSR